MCAGRSSAIKATPLWSAQPSESRLHRIPYHRAKTNSPYFCGPFLWIRAPFSSHEKERFFSFPVDPEFNTHKTAVSAICLNLQDGKSQALIESMVSQTEPAAVQLGRPCGTCSGARDKSLPPHLRAQFLDPPPLRDANNLLGFPTLAGTQALKVHIDNDLYRWRVKTLHICWLWGVLTLLVKKSEDPDFLL